MTNEQELKKKLAEWAGFQWLEATDGNYHWFDANGDIVSSTDEDGNVIWDMNACFKWLVPEALGILAKKGYVPPIMKLFQLWYDELVSLTGDSSNVQQAALALCIVIEKLIDSEAKE